MSFFTKKKLLTVVVVAGMAMPLFAQADKGGSGVLNFTGEVIDAACSISADSADQSIKLGSATITALNAGNTAKKEFKIKLENCDLSKDHAAKVTFTGPLNGDGTTPPDGFATLGSASNIAIRMYEEDGTTAIKPGTSSTAVILNHTNNNELTFVAAAEKDEASDDITEGNFTAAINFNLEYN